MRVVCFYLAQFQLQLLDGLRIKKDGSSVNPLLIQARQKYIVSWQAGQLASRQTNSTQVRHSSNRQLLHWRIHITGASLRSYWCFEQQNCFLSSTGSLLLLASISCNSFWLMFAISTTTGGGSYLGKVRIQTKNIFTWWQLYTKKSGQVFTKDNC